jgi:hypothetical protein
MSLGEADYKISQSHSRFIQLAIWLALRPVVGLFAGCGNCSTGTPEVSSLSSHRFRPEVGKFPGESGEPSGATAQFPARLSWPRERTLKVALTVTALFPTTVHEPVPEQPPLQPTKREPDAAAAVTVTSVPAG